MKQSYIVKIASVVFLSMVLSGCMVSAAMTGAEALYNRHAWEEKINDHYTALAAYRSVYVDTKQFQGSHVAISSFHGSILITGQVENATQKEAIKQRIMSVVGERPVYDYAEVLRPLPALIHLSDSWITSKIKAQLIADNDIDATQIKVITENGTVYLMGTVEPEQAEIAIQIAKDTAGVQKVIKIFSYMSLEKKAGQA